MKAKVLVPTLGMERDKWLVYRRGGIGGSDAPVIMGVNPWSSLMDLWLEKTGEYAEDVDNEAMYWGRTLEDIVAREFVKRTGNKVRRRNAILKHKEHSWMLANVDRLVVGQRAGLECKTTNAFYVDDGSCPPHYYAQVQHYMAVTGYDLWYVAVLAGGQKFYLYTVPRSEIYIESLIKAEGAFWRLVQRGTPPQMDGSEASNRTLALLYPEATEDEIDLPIDAFTLIQQYELAAEMEKKAKLEKDEAANVLKQMLGEAKQGRIYDRKVSWTNVTSKRFNTKTFQKDYEELYEAYCKESSYRRFSIK